MTNIYINKNSKKFQNMNLHDLNKYVRDFFLKPAKYIDRLPINQINREVVNMKLVDKDKKIFVVDSTGLSRSDHDKIRGKSLEEAKKIIPALKVKAVK